MRPFRLAHISDPHLGPLPPVKRRELASKRITGYANWMLNRRDQMGSSVIDGLVAHMLAQTPDHVAVTGDLVNLALPGEFENAAAWLSTLGEPADVSVVPGNHDTYVPGALAKAVDAWRPWMSGDETGGVGDVRLFPYLRRRGHVAVIGVNSGRASMPFLATGSFRERQARALGGLLRATGEAGLFRVVMIHHPPFPNATAANKRLIGASRFRNVVRDHGAELVLHGHTHIVSRQTIEGPHGPVPVIGVPSTSHAPRVAGGTGKPGARYNWFEIEADGTFVHREYGYGDGADTVTLLAEHAAPLPEPA